MVGTMRAVRLHRPGQPLLVDHVDLPSPQGADVLVKVHASGVVPNMRNVAHVYRDHFPHIVVPSLPAVFGLDAAGVVTEKGPQAHGVQVGDRVYVNPGRHCGGCRECRMGRILCCPYFALAGYIGGPLAAQLFEDYPYGAMSEYITAPTYSLVQIPDNVSYETAARFGYLGTGYHALRQVEAGWGDVVLVNGIGGTLGVGIAVLALALGARLVLGTGRDRTQLERVRALAPDRIHVHAADDAEPVVDWVARVTGGAGARVAIDALGPDAPGEAALQAINSLGRGGQYVTVGVVGEVPIALNEIMDSGRQIIGSAWFTTAEAQEIADMAGVGQVDLSVFEHEVFDLADVNEALTAIEGRRSGFSNYVVCP